MEIKQKQVIQSVANALQYISYYHAPDFIKAMANAHEKETHQSAKNAIAQILINSKNGRSRSAPHVPRHWYC
jgi:fumarase (EC 4.2.1.2)